MITKKEVTTDLTSSRVMKSKKKYSTIQVLMFIVIMLFMMSVDSWDDWSIDLILFHIGLGFIVPIIVLIYTKAINNLK
jgi:hypothetical protein